MGTATADYLTSTTFPHYPPPSSGSPWPDPGTSLPPNQHHQTNTALPFRLRQALEALSGLDLAEVRVYPDSSLPAQFGAQAFAFGHEIYLAPGAGPALAHEAWHVVQQMQGRVSANGVLRGLALNDDAVLEQEADQMAALALKLCEVGPLPAAPLSPLRACPIPAARVVMQRQIVIGDAHPADITQIRSVLNTMGVNATNTPNLTAILPILAGDDLSFIPWPSWDAFKLEVKKRDFGMRHLAAMEALKAVHDARLNTYVTNHGNDLELVKKIVTSFRYSGSNRDALIAKYGLPDFITWIDHSGPQKAEGGRKGQFYTWYTTGSTPQKMNCWENVLYAGGWTAGGTRTRLYPREYVLWALMEHDIATAGGIIGTGVDQVPYFVWAIASNPVLHAPRRDNIIEIPETIPAGMVVVFANGQHVALATGRMRRNENKGAREIYGDMGHEVLELDGKTLWMVNGTIEDNVSDGYGHPVYFGWLPNVPTANTITLRSRKDSTVIHTAQVPQTDFYA